MAMIPATMLVPLHINKAFGGVTIVDMSLVLFTSGLGTIIFSVLTKGKIPAYLGSSFAYISLTIYLIQEQLEPGTSHTTAFTYVCWAYVFSGFLLFIFSLLYFKKGIERFFSFLMPSTVIGPAISLIGLELADTAVVDSGFDIEDGLVDSNAAIVAITTLVVIVLFSLLKHKFFKNTAIIVGMVVGCAVSFAINGFPEGYFTETQLITVPQFKLLAPPTDIPKLLGLFVAIIPATFIVFTENIGRFTVINRMTRDSSTRINAPTNKTSSLSPEVIDDDTGENDIFTETAVKEMRASVRAHGFATLFSGLLGSVPNTIYAENIAVMSIHRNENKFDEPDPFIKKLTSQFSVTPYIFAALLAILFSFSGYLQEFLLRIPRPVIGGMELFLFGIISAPGIQLLVEQRVNYKKISNQITTAAVLISGISGLSINLGFVELKGMGLGFVVGVTLNLIIRFIKWLGNISDVVSFDEAVCEILSSFSDNTEYRIIGYKKNDQTEIDYQCNYNIKGVTYALKGKDCRVLTPNGQWISDDTIRDEIKHTVLLEVGIGEANTTDAVLRFKKTVNGLFLDIKSCAIPEEKKKTYLNDYSAIDEDGDWLVISISDIPIRRIKALIHIIDKEKTYCEQAE